MKDRVATALADRYRVERELGQGGMATVYLAHDVKHDRKVAVKVLREDLAASLGGGRFLREIKIAAQLQHPNILPLLDSGEVNGFLFYVMPYVSGQSLRERIAREGELPVDEAVRLITEVVDALAHAHSHGVVHRDIKPDNVMLSGRHALVADFGVAKAVSEATGRSTVTTLGVAVGTPTYMSPEQAAADPHIDHRSDIYAAGVMAYELLTGQPPFVGATPQSVLAAHVTQAPDPVSHRRPGIAPPLDAVIMRCLAKRPSDRFQSAEELLAALEPFGTPSSGITPTQTRPIAAAGARRPLLWIGTVVVLLLGALGFWRLTHGSGDSGATQAIAVLPFDNVAHDTAVDYLTDGIASDVRSGLMKLPGLVVKARTSSEAARGKPVHEAGAMLNVGVILQGTYRHAADKTTVSVDLVKVADESALWSGNFTLPSDGNFSAAQDSITAAVKQALHLASANGSASAAQQRGTTDMPAYDDYLEGEFFFAKRGGENLQRAVDYFQRAIVRDANFARARAGLAMVYSILPGYSQIGGTDSIGPTAERSARQALAIDSMLVEGHVALANALVAEARPLEAVTEFRKALALDPRDAIAHQWLGDALNLLGQQPEAIREGRAAIDLDPLSAVAANDLAYTLLCAGQFAEALVVSHRVRELDPGFAIIDYYAGEAFAFQRQTDSAVVALDRFFRIDSMAPEARAMQVWRFALVGDWSAAQGEMKALDRTITGGSRDVDIAAAAMALGDRETALAAIEREGAKKAYYLATLALGCDPLLSPLRSEPRFIAVVKEMGQGICTNTVRWPVSARPAGKP